MLSKYPQSTLKVPSKYPQSTLKVPSKYPQSASKASQKALRITAEILLTRTLKATLPVCL